MVFFGHKSPSSSNGDDFGRVDSRCSRTARDYERRRDFGAAANNVSIFVLLRCVPFGGDPITIKPNWVSAQRRLRVTTRCRLSR